MQPLMAFLILSPCLDYNHEPPHPVCTVLENKPGTSVCQASSALSHIPTPLTGIETYDQEYMTGALLSFNMGDQKNRWTTIKTTL